MQETVMYIDQRIENLSVSKPPDDVYSLISDYCRGNPRKLGHLFALVKRLLQINDDLVDGVTSEVVKTAREMMLLRAGRIETLGELANAVQIRHGIVERKREKDSTQNQMWYCEIRSNSAK